MKTPDRLAPLLAENEELIAIFAKSVSTLRKQSGK
jgi:hypothetical protein